MVFFSPHIAQIVTSPHSPPHPFSKIVSSGIVALILGLQPLATVRVNAQVTSDGTLSTTVTSSDTLNFVIEGGHGVGEHLFHSFDEFSIPTNGSAHFNNPTDIDIIFSRVTGDNISTISGILSANGTSDLFLINPAGIIFGPGATLNLGGSFMATTAEHISFSDEVLFSAVNPGAQPLLTINTPIGLGFGSQSGAITVENSGHRLNDDFFDLAPVTDAGSPMGLRVNPGNTLGLLGQTIHVSGGIVSAPGGQTALGGVEAGTVQLERAPQGWDLDFDTVDRFGDISLSQAALIDGSGIQTSLIRLQGHNINVSENSFVLISSQGTEPGGLIEVNAANRLRMQRFVDAQGLSGAILSQSLGSLDKSQGADISVTAGQVDMMNAAQIRSITYAAGTGGHVTIQVENDLNLMGVGPLRNTIIDAVTINGADGGSLSVSARNIRITDGALLITATFGSGDSGELWVNASESITVRGFSPRASLSSGIATTSLSASGGNASRLTVNTARLTVENSGTLGATAFGTGNAGNVIVNASEFIRVRGIAESEFALARSSIDSSVLNADERFQALFGLDIEAIGNSGNVIITTPQLLIMDGAEVAVRNEGKGDAGDRLQVQADRIILERGGRINAATESGNGGNIVLISNILGLDNHSIINTEAIGTGNGGNLIIDSSIIFGVNNSDLVTNAVDGNGGSVSLKTQGLFGLAFRDRLTSNSDITTSSEFGLDGTVDISAFNAELESGLLELPSELIDVSDRVALGCSNVGKNRFTLTGRGGLPTEPNGDRPWLQLLPDFGLIPDAQSALSHPSIEWGETTNLRQDQHTEVTAIYSNRFQEATGMAIASDGTLQLVAASSQRLIPPYRTCTSELNIS